MKTYKLVNNEKLSHILIALLIFASIYFGRDTLVSMGWLNFTVTQLFLYFLIFIYTILFVWTNKFHLREILNDTRFKFLLITSSLFMMGMIVKRDFQLMYISCIISIYYSVLLSFISNLKRIGVYFVNSMVFLTVMSLITIIIVKPLIFNGIVNFPTIKNLSGLEFSCCYFSFLVKDPMYVRNFCIFREPGVFQFFLLMSIILENFFIKRSNFKKIVIINIILVIGVVSTFSTAAFIQLFIVTIAMMIKDYKAILTSRFRYLYLLIGLITVSFIIYFIFTNETLYWEVWSMVTKLFRVNDSLMSRITSITSNLQYLLQNPLFGSKLSDVLYATNNTNSSLILFSCYGVFIGLIFNILWIKILHLKVKNKLEMIANLLIIIVVFISLNTQNLTTNFYFYLFPVLVYFENWRYSKSYISKKLV